MAKVSAALLNLVCNNLDITWSDAGTKAKVRNEISRGMAELDDHASVPQDYETPGLPQRLLIEYCRYDQAGALADFFVNYKGDLIALRMRTQTASFMTAKGEGAADLEKED